MQYYWDRGHTIYLKWDTQTFVCHQCKRFLSTMRSGNNLWQNKKKSSREEQLCVRMRHHSRKWGLNFKSEKAQAHGNQTTWHKRCLLLLWRGQANPALTESAVTAIAPPGDPWQIPLAVGIRLLQNHLLRQKVPIYGEKHWETLGFSGTITVKHKIFFPHKSSLINVLFLKIQILNFFYIPPPNSYSRTKARNG